MVGKRIEFKNPEYNKNFMSYVNGKLPTETLNGIVLDKISEAHGRVSPAWARSSDGNSNDVAVTETHTYYMVAEDKTGIMHRLSPCKILKLLNVS